MSNLPVRKRIRLQHYDYSLGGCYFLTICVKGRKELLGTYVTTDATVGAIINRPQPTPSASETTDATVGAIINRPQITLSAYGKIVDETVNNIDKHYPNVRADKYVIMPNHVHMLLFNNMDDDEQENGGRLIIAPTANVSTIVQQFKRHVSKVIGTSIWQKSYFDHVIRDEMDYLSHWKYIDENILKWDEDEYY